MSEEKLMMKALSMDIITAKMFTELHLSITEAYGEDEGRKLVHKGLEAFGLRDAETMAKKKLQQKGKITPFMNIYHRLLRAKKNMQT